MTSLCDTNWYSCERDGSLQSVCREYNVHLVMVAAEETQPFTMQTKYQQTHKKRSKVVKFEISSAEPFRSTSQFLARHAVLILS